MSDRDTSPSSSQSVNEQPPSDNAIEETLRGCVAAAFKNGTVHELTVRQIRTEAEEILGLDNRFFKNDSQWKTKSDHIIKEEVV